MPASNIAIWACPNGTCSSVAKEVCGLTTPSAKALTDLGNIAGFKTPFKMSDFFGYDNFVVSPLLTSNISTAGTNVSINILAPTINTFTISDTEAWLTYGSPVTPAPVGGGNQTITVASNSGAARVGCVCFTPSWGARKDPVFCQLGSSISPLYLCNVSYYATSTYACRVDQLIGWQNNAHCSCIAYGFRSYKYTGTGAMCYSVTYNGFTVHNCLCSTSSAVNTSSSFAERLTTATQAVCLTSIACRIASTYVLSTTCVVSITNIVGCYCLGSPITTTAAVGNP